MENKYKAKLKRRGQELYIRYFFNNDEVIEQIINDYDNNKYINESICQVVFDVDLSYKNKVYELIKYYPNTLRDIKIVTKDVIYNLYLKYGETIDIMNKYSGSKNVRGKICESALKRAKEKGIMFDITNEDVILTYTCLFLEIPLEYGNSKCGDYSASIDRIDSSKGYIKDNIQIISMLANSMKSSASPDQLVRFSKNVLKIYN